MFALGPSLFQVVVDNDDTVTKILNQMRRDNIRGRVTFMPLNRLRTPTVDIPTADDAVPMISKLRFDRTYRLAFEQVRQNVYASRLLVDTDASNFRSSEEQLSAEI